MYEKETDPGKKIKFSGHDVKKYFACGQIMLCCTKSIRLLTTE